MAWLKEWDKCVFKRAAPKKRKYGLEEEDVYVSRVRTKELTAV